MIAILLSIGDELLIGQTVNTNATWLGQQMTAQGIKIAEAITIADTEQAILDALDYSLAKADIVLITGGLGPTSDDLTLPCLMKYFRSETVWDERVWENIRQIFHMRGREINDASKQLSYVPHNAQIIYNTQGTAPGTIFFNNGKMVASMPGVPYEMKAMVELDVIPFIRQNFQLPFIINRHILTAGVGETQLAALLVDFEKNLPENCKLAYLPNVGKVKLRVSCFGNDLDELKSLSDTQFNTALKAVERYVYGVDDDSLEEGIGRLLIEKQLQLCTAESCTGGYIGHLITSVAGSSAYFKGGIISYSNEMKMNILKVQQATLDNHGAVSAETVREMIAGALSTTNSDIAIAVSGVAGPGGGSEEKPVGTVFVGVGNTSGAYVKKFQFTQHRERNIQLSGVVALVLLRNFILGHLQANG